MRFLISGAGVAGLSTAVNLGANDHDVTIVERAEHSGGNAPPIDIRATRSTWPARWGCSGRFANAGSP